MAGLTPKQRKFVSEYLVDLNATQSAIRAGFSQKTARAQGQRLLTNVDIANAIAAAQAKREKRTEITQDRVVQELARIAFGNIRSVMSWTASGMRLRNSDDLTEDEAAIVSEVRETTTKDGGSRTLKTHDKLKALELLGKHLGMFEKKPEDPEAEEVAGIEVRVVNGRREQ